MQLGRFIESYYQEQRRRERSKGVIRRCDMTYYDNVVRLLSVGAVEERLCGSKLRETRNNSL